jgi:hypothetical protein
MLQCPFISTIVFKDLDWKLGLIATTNSTYTQVTLSLMDGGLSSTRPMNSPPCVSQNIHNKYLRVPLWIPHNVQKTVKKHTCWSKTCHISTLAPFRLLIDPCCSLRWVDLRTYALTLVLHILNHMKVRGGCQIEPQASLTNFMDARRQYLKLLGCRIADDSGMSSSPKAPA